MNIRYTESRENKRKYNVFQALKETISSLACKWQKNSILFCFSKNITKKRYFKRNIWNISRKLNFDIFFNSVRPFEFRLQQMNSLFQITLKCEIADENFSTFRFPLLLKKPFRLFHRPKFPNRGLLPFFFLLGSRFISYFVNIKLFNLHKATRAFCVYLSHRMENKRTSFFSVG